jgi:hypothetical protein
MKGASMGQTGVGDKRYSLETSEQLWPLIKDFYAQARQKKKEGEPICWYMSGVPKELLYAMDIVPIMAEEFSSQMATKVERIARYLEFAEVKGFGRDS